MTLLVRAGMLVNNLWIHVKLSPDPLGASGIARGNRPGPACSSACGRSGDLGTAFGAPALSASSPYLIPPCFVGVGLIVRLIGVLGVTQGVAQILFGDMSPDSPSRPVAKGVTHPSPSVFAPSGERSSTGDSCPCEDGFPIRLKCFGGRNRISCWELECWSWVS